MRYLPVRRSVRLKGFDYRAPGAYFVTIVTFKRIEAFGEVIDGAVVLSPLGEAVVETWRSIPRMFPHVKLDVFIVMPNHLHGVLVLNEGTRAKHPEGRDASPLHVVHARGTRSGSVSAVIQTFKALSGRRARVFLGARTTTLWQRGFFDRVVRDAEELDRIRDYVVSNPLNWDLDREKPSRRKT